MTHGAPDWYKYRRDSLTYPIDDLAELAARLGSIVTFDRRGDVIFMDDFRHGTPHIVRYKSGTGAAITPSPVSSKSGPYSLKLTAGSDAGREAGAIYYLPLPPLTTIGFEFSWSLCPPDSTINLLITYRSGTHCIQPWIRYQPNTGNLQYRDKNSVFQNLATALNLESHAHYWHTLKLVANYDAKTYMRLILNNHTYDLTDVPMYSYTDTDPALLTVQPTLLTDATNNPFIYLDNFILTQDEP